MDDFLDLRPERFDCHWREAFVHELAKARVFGGVKEKHPKTEGTGEFGKFLLLFGRKLVNQSASALGRKSGIPKKCRAICMLESGDRKSTRLNSSHGYISYAVFCLKKKNAT